MRSNWKAVTRSHHEDLFSWYNADTLDYTCCYINRAKFKLINDWFDCCFTDFGKIQKPILILSGPAGSGKTFCVNFIARSKNILLNDIHNSPNRLKRKYKALVMEESQSLKEIHSSERQVDLYDNFSFSLWKPQMLNEILQSTNPVLIIVTSPINMEPSINVWLRDLKNCQRVLHIEYIS